jgi:hypothetical protein
MGEDINRSLLYIKFMHSFVDRSCVPHLLFVTSDQNRGALHLNISSHDN